jgi:two-component system sensor histidine kinase KdpD
MLLGYFDFVHALRALVNLLENAMKYSAAESAIEISVRRDGETLVFTVADRGPGVPELERERIFEPFYRPPGVPPDIRGAGLGLAIAQGLAVAQGGAVRYEARAGGGSLFHLILPTTSEAS